MHASERARANGFGLWGRNVAGWSGSNGPPMVGWLHAIRGWACERVSGENKPLLFILSHFD